MRHPTSEAAMKLAGDASKKPFSSDDALNVRGLIS
jgi:hypothetical protein